MDDIDKTLDDIERKAAGNTIIPEQLLAKLPPLYAQESKGEDAIAHLKVFCPWSDWTWFITEYDPAARICFGLVRGFEDELGYFSLTELESIRGPLGLPLEMDLYFKPTPLRELRERG